MIEMGIKDINDDSKEGKMLLAALSILTSITPDQINENEFGGMTHPDDVIKRVANIANYVYYEEEYKRQEVIEKDIIKRDLVINKLVNE